MAKKLLITGASGFVGRHLCESASDAWLVCGVVHARKDTISNIRTTEADLTNQADIARLFRTVKPDAVVHTAAATNPNHCQAEKAATWKINVDATAELAGRCADRNIPFVFTSTDLVFDGENPPYREEDPPSPLGSYGEQKAIAEENIRRLYPEAAICRLSLMFGFSQGVNFFAKMIDDLKLGKTVRLFTDEYRTQLSAETAARALLRALQNVSGTYHIGGAESVSRYDFGVIAAKVFGIETDCLIPCLREDMKMAAPRPKNVSLDISKARRVLNFNPPKLEEDLRTVADNFFRGN